MWPGPNNTKLIPLSKPICMLISVGINNQLLKIHAELFFYFFLQTDLRFFFSNRTRWDIINFSLTVTFLSREVALQWLVWFTIHTLIPNFLSKHSSCRLLAPLASSSPSLLIIRLHANLRHSTVGGKDPTWTWSHRKLHWQRNCSTAPPDDQWYEIHIRQNPATI